MSDVLAKICADKLEHVAACKQQAPLATVEASAKAADSVRPFAGALKAKAAAGEIGLIAEIKKASPSKGLIRENFNPVELAQAYERGGATCLSVLTDVPYFQGSDAYTVQAHEAANLPVLRKDFMLDPYQVVEARAINADCILLIMAALEDAQAAELASTARDWGLDILVEVHNREELDRALVLDCDLVGINNRNLKTLTVDLQTSRDLAPLVPDDRTVVGESGIYTFDEVQDLRSYGINTFLVGESLMRQADVTLATQTLLGQAA